MRSSVVLKGEAARLAANSDIERSGLATGERSTQGSEKDLGPYSALSSTGILVVMDCERNQFGRGW